MKIIWLSHILTSSTPLYGGAPAIIIQHGKSFKSGDSCNTSTIHLNSHSGTHADAPYHFFSDGKTIDDYPASTWVFMNPKIIEVCISPGYLINEADLSDLLSYNPKTDILLLRTGFERYRNDPIYWQDGPGLSGSLARYLKKYYPSLRAIGFDFISISSMRHREEGRIAHKAFLGNEILLIEDMSLQFVNNPNNLYQVVVLPLRYIGADGAPCAILGWENDSHSNAI